MLTKNAASRERPLQRLVGLVFLIAANDAVLHVMVFKHEAEQLQSMSPITAAVTELRVTASALHVIAALCALDVNLNNITIITGNFTLAAEAKMGLVPQVVGRSFWE